MTSWRVVDSVKQRQQRQLFRIGIAALSSLERSLISPVSVAREYIPSASAVPGQATIPSNMNVSSLYRELVEQVLAQSPTFRNHACDADRIAGCKRGSMTGLVRAIAIGAVLRLPLGEPASFVTVAQADAHRGALDPPSAAVSADGRYIAFTSCVQLAPADRDHQRDVYVLDRADGRVTLESGTSPEPALQGDSEHPSLRPRICCARASAPRRATTSTCCGTSSCSIHPHPGWK